MIEKKQEGGKIEKEKTVFVERDPLKFQWHIPLCCSEGWKNCPHVVKREKITKRNIGL